MQMTQPCNPCAFYITSMHAGVGLSDLGSEAMSYVKIFAGIVAANYPERLYRSAPAESLLSHDLHFERCQHTGDSCW